MKRVSPISSRALGREASIGVGSWVACLLTVASACSSGANAPEPAADVAPDDTSGAGSGPDSVRPDSVRPDSVRPDSVRPDSADTDGAPGDANEADGEANEATTSASEALNPDDISNVMEAADPNPTGTPGEPASAPARPVPLPSAGCGGSPDAAASGARALQVEGVERTFLLDAPADYDGTTPYPLVFAFHGATTSGAAFRGRFYGNLLSRLGDEAIVVHPDALGEPTAWNTQADLPFFDALVAQLSADLCVDEGRIFATGHSSGGFFTNALGCQRGEVLRAIAPVSAGGPFTFGGGGCVGQVAVWLAHGENDETVPFDNGERSRDTWLAANACDPEAAEPSAPEPCVEYAGCDAGFPVRWCVYQDGHNWPEFGPEGIGSFFLGL